VCRIFWRYLGILGAAGVVFFAFIVFDGFSHRSPETKDPKKDMPMGIPWLLAICTCCSILFAYVLKE